MIEGLTRIKFEDIKQGDKFIYECHNRWAATDYFVLEAKRVLKTQIETQGGIHILKKSHANDLREYNEQNARLLQIYETERKARIEIVNTKWNTVPQEKINAIYEILKG